MKRQLNIAASIIFLFTCGFPLAAQHAEELFSPWFFGLGPVTTSWDAPGGTIFNPAAAGLEQRTRFELSYLSLADFSAARAWGHAVNLGASLPTNFGVFSANGHFLTADEAAPGLGTLGGLNLALSKDLYPNFLIGLGVSSYLSWRGGEMDWSLGGDIGVIHNLGKVAFLEDVTWALAVRGLGKGLSLSGAADPLPRAFTPALGISLKPVKLEAFTWTLYADMSFPAFSSFMLSAGTELEFFRIALLRGSFHLDTAALDAGSDRFPFSFGLSLVIRLDIKDKADELSRRISGSDLRIDAAYAPLADGLQVMGLGLNLALGSIDKNPPVVKIKPVLPEDAADDRTVYVSPNLDGVQDDLVLTTGITDERFVKGYTLVIENASGQVVRVIENTEERPENVDAQNMLNRLVYIKSGIPVPEALRWDGKIEAGSVAEDGSYAFYVTAWDDNGNRTTTPKQRLVVDKTAPQVTTGVSSIIFSPNGDGNKDTLPLALTGSPEDAWRAAVTDGTGKEVKHFEWHGKAPESIAWDGKNDSGALVDDGVYAFSISAKDRAGNTTSQTVDNIIINTVATPITMSVNTGFFSPNNDGVKDAAVIALAVPVVKGIESWSLKIQNAKKETVSTFSGADTIIISFAFDGRSDTGVTLPEGAYRAVLDVRYANGNNPRAESPDIVLDLTPPKLKLAVDSPVFSPNNDGNKDFVALSLETSEEDEWTAEINDTKHKKAVRTYRWKGKPEARLVWGGQADDGTLLSDGVYNFLIASTDRAGNTTRSDLQALTINTEETPVLFTAGLTHFSPNADKLNDSLPLIPQLKVTAGIDTWTMLVKDKAGKTIKTLSGKKSAPLNIQWDGTSDARAAAADGEYSAVLQVLYINGNNPTAKTAVFYVDTQAPVIVLSSAYILFSPDGDGLKDALPIIQKSSTEELWEARVTDKSGRTVRNVFWKGKAETFNWDGKDDNGNLLPNGVYAYAVSSIDKAGNKAQAALAGIEIDVTPTPVFVTVDRGAFSPNADGAFDSVIFDLYVENRKLVSAWSLVIAHAKTGVQRTFQGVADLPAKISWDGANDAQARAPEGQYSAALTVEYAKGNKPAEKSKTFVLDVSAPEVDFKMNPLPFSPDNDGVEDELALTQKITDATAVAQWKIEITDPEKNHFIVFQGTGWPAEKIIWNGLSDRGELVQAATDYRLVYSIRDEVGNARTFEKTIPVDVLVIRDGDKLYVRVPSITFKPNTADYKDVSKEALDKNLWTLKRLARIFSKYRSYTILIEGHAVSVFWRDPARAQREQTEELIPLSKKRAEAVRQALIDEGIETVRVSTEGVGAKRPLFPFSDEANLWKNRRVEFILLKK